MKHSTAPTTAGLLNNCTWGKRAGCQQFQLAMSNWKWPLCCPGELGDTADHRSGMHPSGRSLSAPIPRHPMEPRRSFQLHWDSGWRNPHSSRSHFTSCHPADSKKYLPKLKSQGQSKTRSKPGREEPPGRVGRGSAAPVAAPPCRNPGSGAKRSDGNMENSPE